MSHLPLDVVRHILDEVEYLLRVSADLSEDAFLENETLRRAFARSLEVIGEASKRVPAEIREQYPAVEWKSMAGMRDRLIHGYFGVDYGLVWDVVQNNIPRLRREIRALIPDSNKQNPPT